MKQYALLGKYEYGNRHNVEVIATSDDCDELTKIWNAINLLNKELEGKDRELRNPKVEKLIEEKLSSVDIIDEGTEFVHEIRTIGLYKISGLIEISCSTCGKVLYEGSEEGKRHLIIYCVDCAQ